MGGPSRKPLAELIRLYVSTPGFRTREVTLVATLTDAVAYPADAIRALYAQR